MHPLVKPAMLIAFVALAGGCATLSEEECRVADWYTIGYEDGVDGRSASWLGEHREACAQYGMVPDLAAYRAGRAEGLEQYCTEQRGFHEGRSGKRYQGVCPAELEDDFLYAYEAGYRLYRAESALDDVIAAIHDRRAEREYIRDTIGEKEDRLVSDDTAEDERRKLIREIKRLQDRHGALGAEIHELERERVLREAEFHALRYDTPFP